jgi:zinc protease
MRKITILTLSVMLACFAWLPAKTAFQIDFEKYVLDNGLEVILHEDRSDPLVAVAILFHVGSNREVKGRTGFAHLFEHMLFQESQHVGQDQFFKKIQDAGGTLNGGTWKDGTVYYEVIPKNALEMVLWMESDRMGWLLSTVTQEAFDNQQDVVQNEKRQRYDNQPYGQTRHVVDSNLYPEEHPYNWLTIGSLQDIGSASLQDVRDFFERWYGANNATLVIAGDFDETQTRAWVEKYFGEIEHGQKVEAPKPNLVTLNQTRRVYHVDHLAPSPELNMVFPTVQQFSKDAYALDVLGDLLADGKKSPLYKVVVEEKELAPSVSAYQNSQEIAGDFRFTIRAFPDKNLAECENAIFEALARFEKDGFTDKDLSRIKAKIETDFYDGISSVLNKSFQLASYNEFAGAPDFIEQDLQRALDVKKEDVQRVYDEYIKGKPFVLTSFVPKDRVDLVASDSKEFLIPEESIDGPGPGDESKEAIAIGKIPSSFDRSVEPGKGPDPSLNLPDVWQSEYKNGLRILGVEHHELPLVRLSITMKGGLLLDSPDKVGVANLMTDIMMQGTRNKTPIELEEAIDELGAEVGMYTTRESIVIWANCLSSKFVKVYALVEEILLEPRWDAKEFARVKRETIERINRSEAQPATIADNVLNKLLYGEKHILGHSTYGTVESVETISLDDLKAFYAKNYSPSVAHISLAGDISKDKGIKTFGSLEKKWKGKEVKFTDYKIPSPPDQAQVYFVDIPGTKQSEIRIGHMSLAYNDPDYHAVSVMNYKLGGSFSGIVNLILREEKGYTYGARTSFQGQLNPGPFVARAGVKSSATSESVQIFRHEMAKYRNGIGQEDLDFTRNALVKSDARDFETLGALMGMVNNIAFYGFPEDYVERQRKTTMAMTLERHKELAQAHIHPDKAFYLVVGDAETQLAPLRELGIAEPVLLDKSGKVKQDTSSL